jgi:hypothetical protein
MMDHLSCVLLGKSSTLTYISCSFVKICATENPGEGPVKDFWIRGLGEYTTQHSDLK